MQKVTGAQGGHADVRAANPLDRWRHDRLWEVSDLAALLEADERGVRKRGVIYVFCKACQSIR